MGHLGWFQLRVLWALFLKYMLLSAIDTFDLCGPPRAITIDWIIGEICGPEHYMCVRSFRLILKCGKGISYESLNHVILKWYLLTIRIFDDMEQSGMGFWFCSQRE